MSKKIGVDKEFAAIGEFVVAFEGLVNDIRRECHALLTDGDFWQEIFTERHHALLHIVVHSESLTAWSLCSMLQQLIGEISKDSNPMLVKEFSGFCGKFSELVSARNKLLHSSYDFEVALGDRFKLRGAKGKSNAGGFSVFLSDTTYIREQIELANELSERLRKMYMPIHVQQKRHLTQVVKRQVTDINDFSDIYPKEVS